jgi:hypothetical protein
MSRREIENVSDVVPKLENECVLVESEHGFQADGLHNDGSAARGGVVKSQNPPIPTRIERGIDFDDRSSL